MTDRAADRSSNRGRLIALAIGVVAVAVIAAAVLRGRARANEVRVEGQTIDATGAPLPEVQISLEIAPAESEGELPVERVSTRSDARGRFSIRCRVPWHDPSYSLEASKAGFETVTIDDADELPNPLMLRLAASHP